MLARDFHGAVGSRSTVVEEVLPLRNSRFIPFGVKRQFGLKETEPKSTLYLTYVKASSIW